MLKIFIVFLLLVSHSSGDYACTMAGSDVEQYSQAYDDALDEYESAEPEEKEDALEEVRAAKEQLLDAVDDVVDNCENRQIDIFASLFSENKSLKAYISKLERKNSILMNEVAILKIQKKYPRFDIAKVVSYLKKYQQKYGTPAAEKLNTPAGWVKIWVNNFEK